MGKYTIKLRFEIRELLSEDLVSFCYMGESLETGDPVLIWKYKPEYTPEPFVHQLLELCERLVLVSHHNVLNLLDYDFDGTYLYTVYEYFPGMMTLETYLKTEAQWVAKKLWKMTTQILSVMVSLESEDLVAGVISLSGIYVTGNSDVKLARVELYIRVIQQYFTHFDVIEECMFLAPELIQDQDYSIKSDVYSFGVLTYFLFSKQWPYPMTLRIKDLKKGFLKGLRPFQKKSSYIPDKLSEVISICLSMEPSKRFVNFSSLVRNYRQNQLTEVFDESSKSHVLEDMQRDMQKKNKEKMKQLMIAGVIGVVLVIGIFSGLQVLKRYVTAIPETTVPALIGLNEASAKEALRKCKLKGVVVSVRPNSKFNQGLVFDSKPPSGRVVKQNREVKLFISSGSRPVAVPELVGLTQERAMEILLNRGLGIEISDTVFSSKYQEGIVLSQQVSPNALVQPSSNIGIVVSGGFPVKISVSKATNEVGAKPLAADLRYVSVSLHMLQEWDNRMVTIYFTSNKQREKIYSEQHMGGENVDLQFKLNLNGMLDVFFNENLMVSQKVQDPKLTSTNVKAKL